MWLLLLYNTFFADWTGAIAHRTERMTMCQRRNGCILDHLSSLVFHHGEFLMEIVSVSRIIYHNSFNYEAATQNSAPTQSQTNQRFRRIWGKGILPGWATRYRSVATSRGCYSRAANVDEGSWAFRISNDTALLHALKWCEVLLWKGRGQMPKLWYLQNA